MTEPFPCAQHGPDLTDLIAALPKAELHLHLEGSITPETWLRLIRRHEPATALTAADLRERMRFRDMAGFFDVWMQVLHALRDPEDYRLAAYECARALQRQNVVYAEVHTSIAGAQWSGRLNADEMLPAIAEGFSDAQREGGPAWGLIVDVIRDCTAAGAWEIGLDLALRHRRNGVVAIGLGGDEARFATETAREVFAAAAGAGLHRTAHAGESAGPHSIWAALGIGAERIGHAARAPEDPDLVAHLAERGVPLEMCPTSNLRTGAVPSLEQHPIGTFLRRGMNVSLSTDDPPLFGADLLTEYRRVAETFHLTRAEVVRLARNAFAAAFLPDAPKAELLARFDAAAPAC